MTWNNHGVLITDPEQVVLESDPYRRLSYAWHTVTPELAKRFGWDDDLYAKIAGEPRSTVTFEIDDTGTNGSGSHEIADASVVTGVYVFLAIGSITAE